MSCLDLGILELIGVLSTFEGCKGSVSECLFGNECLGIVFLKKSISFIGFLQLRHLKLKSVVN